MMDNKTKFNRFVSGRNTYISNSIEDHGGNIFRAFSHEENAIRRDLGDFVFLSFEHRLGTTLPKSLLICTEYSKILHHDRSDVCSFVATFLDPKMFAQKTEFFNTDFRYLPLSWEQGINWLNALASISPEITEKELFKNIMKINSIPKSTLSHDEMRQQVGDVTGCRLEMSF